MRLTRSEMLEVLRQDYVRFARALGLSERSVNFRHALGFKAATQAIITLGGMGYAKEYHVERLMRESLIPKLAPVSAQMILNCIYAGMMHCGIAGIRH